MRSRHQLFGSRNYIALLFGLLISASSIAQSIDTNIQSSAISKEVESFLRAQTNQLPADTEITVKPIDGRLKLQSCEELKAFLPPGTKAWGKITVGVRCAAPKSWTVYVAAQVRVFGDYYVTKNPVSVGQKINEQDIITIRGEVSSLAPGTALSIDKVIGKTMQSAYPAGTSFRNDMFKSIPVIQQGQSIKIISEGPGFRVSNDAVAINNANEGQVTRAKTASGVIVSGVARAGGFIEIQ